MNPLIRFFHLWYRWLEFVVERLLRGFCISLWRRSKFINLSRPGIQPVLNITPSINQSFTPPIPGSISRISRTASKIRISRANCSASSKQITGSSYRQAMLPMKFFYCLAPDFFLISIPFLSATSIRVFRARFCNSSSRTWASRASTSGDFSS